MPDEEYTAEDDAARVRTKRNSAGNWPETQRNAMRPAMETHAKTEYGMEDRARFKESFKKENFS